MDEMTIQPLYKNRDWMHEHHIVLQESTVLIAQKAGCSQPTIWRWLRKFNIPTRTLSEAIFLAERNYLNLSDKLSNLLEGELLGDGCITMNSSRSALYSHGSKYEEYLIWLSKKLDDLGLEQVGKINKYWVESGNAFVYNYTSRSYPELVPMRQRFYPDGKKIVPRDLILAPIMARQWYLGDGGLRKEKGRRSDINFSTCDFDKASIDHLLEELGRNGFKATHRPAKNIIGMSVESVKDFLAYIGPPPIDCYQYKWDYQDNRKKAR